METEVPYGEQRYIWCGAIWRAEVPHGKLRYHMVNQVEPYGELS
jgi:hypothetical protein